MYENEKGESQLDDLTDWLNLSLESKSQFYRLPVAILQSESAIYLKLSGRRMMEGDGADNRSSKESPWTD